MLGAIPLISTLGLFGIFLVRGEIDLESEPEWLADHGIILTIAEMIEEHMVWLF